MKGLADAYEIVKEKSSKYDLYMCIKCARKVAFIKSDILYAMAKNEFTEGLTIIPNEDSL